MKQERCGRLERAYQKGSKAAEGQRREAHWVIISKNPTIHGL